MYSRYVVSCQRWTKKCGLSNKSETEKDQKKFREEGPDCNQINQKSNTPDNIFTESLNSPDSSAGSTLPQQMLSVVEKGHSILFKLGC